MMSFKKMVAMGMLAATTALAAGAVTMHTVPSLVAYAEGESEKKETATCESYGSLQYSSLSGNYIYVTYYTDEECTKEKSTAVYTAEELDGTIPLGGLNLKKGGYFKVYDELTTADEVKAVTIAPQAGKIKVKVKDPSKDTILEALEITVNGTAINAANAGNYKIYFNGTEITTAASPATDGQESSAATMNDDLWKQIKLAARANGETIQVQCYEKNGMPSEAKFKVAAVPKAPKVTIDYVNGNYVLPKGVNYIVTKVDGDGKVVVPGADVKAVATTAKETLSVDAILKASVASTESAQANAEVTLPDAAALIVQTAAVEGKKQASMQVVYKVTKLDALTFTASEDASTGSAKVTVGETETEVATFKFTKTGVTITAKADIAYYDTAKSKWVTLKNTKSTKEIALANNGEAKLRIKTLGVKATKKFGSSEEEVTNNFKEAEEPTPTPTTGA